MITTSDSEFINQGWSMFPGIYASTSRYYSLFFSSITAHWNEGDVAGMVKMWNSPASDHPLKGRSCLDGGHIVVAKKYEHRERSHRTRRGKSHLR